MTWGVGVISDASGEEVCSVPPWNEAPCNSNPDNMHVSGHKDFRDLGSLSQEQIILTRSIAVFNFLAVCCLNALMKVAGLNKSPNTKGSFNNPLVPLFDAILHFINDILLRTNSLSQFWGLSGPPSHLTVHSDGTIPDRRDVAAACIAGVKRPEPKRTYVYMRVNEWDT